MKKKKEVIGTISGKALLMNRSGKLNRNDGIVKSGTGYHKNPKAYSRKGKKNQQLKSQLKRYEDKPADFFIGGLPIYDLSSLLLLH